MVNPELRKRFVNSIEYLRKMEFFKDYSELSSEEILDKIFSGEIDYESQWFVEETRDEQGEEYIKKVWKKTPRGVILREWVERDKEYWMKRSEYEVDLELASFDKNRIFIEAVETIVSENIGIYLMRRLTRISRGVFTPADLREEEWSEWEGEAPPNVKKYVYSSYGDWTRIRVSFKFRNKEHAADFFCNRDYLVMGPAVEEINELIKDTGYQYYELPDEYFYFIVLTQDEAERLRKERGWKYVKLH
ncbi:hypothetical protein [Infirmifilum uzonense]|uniref:hypothetical protein n=1 Tax=Infirmifilum uzonense TaxID=1550241 RepID=UPI003C738DA7